MHFEFTVKSILGWAIKLAAMYLVIVTFAWPAYNAWQLRKVLAAAATRVDAPILSMARKQATEELTRELATRPKLKVDLEQLGVEPVEEGKGFVLTLPYVATYALVKGVMVEAAFELRSDSPRLWPAPPSP